MFGKFFTNPKQNVIIKNILSFKENCQYVNLSNDRLIVVEDNSLKIFSIIDFKQIIEKQFDFCPKVEAIAPDDSILLSVSDEKGKNLIKISPYNLEIYSKSPYIFDDFLKCFFIGNSYLYAISSKTKKLYIFQEEKETNSIKEIKRFSLTIRRNGIIQQVEKFEFNQFSCVVRDYEKNVSSILVFMAFRDEESYDFLREIKLVFGALPDEESYAFLREIKIDGHALGSTMCLLANGDLLTYNAYKSELMIWNSKTGVCTNKLDLSKFSELKNEFLTIIPSPDPSYLVIEERLGTKLYLFHINDSVLKEIVFPSNVNFNAEKISHHLLGNGQLLRIMNEPSKQASKQIHFDLKETMHYRKTMFDKLILCHYALSNKGKLPWDIINLIFSAGIISTPVNQYFDDKNMMLLENQEEETNTSCLMM